MRKRYFDRLLRLLFALMAMLLMVACTSDVTTDNEEPLKKIRRNKVSMRIRGKHLTMSGSGCSLSVSTSVVLRMIRWCKLLREPRMI